MSETAQTPAPPPVPAEDDNPPEPTPPKTPSPPTAYLVLSKDADKDQWWIEVGIYSARTPHKAIEQAMRAAKRESGTFAAVPQSKWTVKTPRTETTERIVWD